MHRIVPHTARACAFAALAIALGLPSTAAALPLISEVFYDASGSDNGLSFVEIVGTPGGLLDGYTIEAVNGSNGAITHSLDLLGTIPADGIFVLADDVGDGTSLVAGADQILNFDFQNGPDSVLLIDGTGVVDAVGYGVFGSGEFFAGEGLPAADAPAGSSLARRFADLDTDDNASDWVVLAQPTPGSAPLQPVPEPSLPALFAAGLVVLAGRARRRRWSR
jgi:hypothetical protein